MSAVIVIPARYASTRYPAKPLVEVAGKSMIQRVWDIGRKVKNADAVYVSTDDERIADHAHSFGAEVIMTSDLCENGTARVAEAVTKLPQQPDIAVNLQGDAPLTPPWFVEELISAMEQDTTCQMATPGLKLTPAMYRLFREDRKNDRVGGTTLVFDKQKNALFFSKEVIPYLPPEALGWEEVPAYHHVGLYAYRPQLLEQYITWKAGPLEQVEKLEQLRVLEHGERIKIVIVDDRGRSFWEINNPEDVPRVEKILQDEGEL
jgi:3-deoxy-manno-octulosonate cytidylyltransferase (CMP-KDO synthetase)